MVAMVAMVAMACTGVSSRREPNFKAPIHLGLVLALGASLSLLSLLSFGIFRRRDNLGPGS